LSKIQRPDNGYADYFGHGWNTVYLCFLAASDAAAAWIDGMKNNND
jgi:hypothetical protein